MKAFCSTLWTTNTKGLFVLYTWTNNFKWKGKHKLRIKRFASTGRFCCIQTVNADHSSKALLPCWVKPAKRRPGQHHSRSFGESVDTHGFHHYTAALKHAERSFTNVTSWTKSARSRQTWNTATTEPFARGGKCETYGWLCAVSCRRRDRASPLRFEETLAASACPGARWSHRCKRGRSNSGSLQVPAPPCGSETKL